MTGWKVSSTEWQFFSKLGFGSKMSVTIKKNYDQWSQDTFVMPTVVFWAVLRLLTAKNMKI